MIRLMQEGDIPSAAKIEQQCFSQPWSEATLRSCLKSNLDVLYVLEVAGDICGYCCLRVITDESEIERICILPEYRGRGYAKKLMDTMVDYSKEKGVKDMTLEVRMGNYAAIKLYKTYAFMQEAVRKKYYQHPEEDALIMWRRGV